MRDEKWIMFKNYMHNELNITKDDIRQWIEDAVHDQALRLVNKEFNDFDVQNIVKRIITDDDFFGSQSLKRDISVELSKQIMNKLNL